jgi:hypothetical protein
MAELKNLNPANRPGKDAAERKRIPMSVPVSRLAAPDVPGYHLHWFNGTNERIQRAVDAGYEPVYDHEVKINNVSLGGDSTASGNTDMGSQVSVVAGTELDGAGQPIRLILMKIKEEYYQEDQKSVERRNASVADALTGGQLGAGQNGSERPEDAQQRYVDKKRTAIPDLFKPKVRPRPQPT